MPEVWINPRTGGVESTREWQRRLNAGDPEAHRELAALSNISEGAERPPRYTARESGSMLNPWSVYDLELKCIVRLWVTRVAADADAAYMNRRRQDEH